MENSKPQPISEPFRLQDMTYWGRLRYWSATEIVALTLGWEPRLIGTWQAGLANGFSAHFYLYNQHTEIVSRAMEAGELAEKNIPAHAINWMDQLRFPYPPDLRDAVFRLGSFPDWRALYDEAISEAHRLSDELTNFQHQHSKTAAEYEAQIDALSTFKNEAMQILRSQAEALDHNELVITELRDALDQMSATPDLALKTRERNNMLRLLLGVALEQYGYDPQSARSDVPRLISDDLASQKLSVSSDTVRKYLRMAADEFWEPQDD